MDKQELFNTVFRQMLDYADNDFVKRLADWGVEIYNLLDRNNKIISTNQNEPRNDQFIYAVAIARIVGLFGMRAFNDHLSDEIEFGDPLPKTRLRNIWVPVYSKIDEIYSALIDIYKQQGEDDPNHKILSSLKEVFGEISQTNFNEPQAYDFVRNRFNY